MTGNRDIERELQAIESEYASRGGQQAGSPRLRGLRCAIELEVQRLRGERDEARALLREMTQRWLCNELCSPAYAVRCGSCAAFKARLDAALAQKGGA